MKKKVLQIIKWAGGIIMGLLATLLIINQIDSAPPEHDFTMADLKPAEIRFDNGFYGLTTLFEDSTVDVYSQVELEKVKHHFSLQTLHQAENQFKLNSESKWFYRLDDRALVDYLNFFTDVFPRDNLLAFFRKDRAGIERLAQKYAFLLDRYERMLHAPAVEDFTCPHPLSPVPSLLASKAVCRLYIAKTTLAAADGRWEESICKLQANALFWSRVIANARPLINLLIAIVNLVNSEEALADLMNQRDCPPELCSMISAGLRSTNLSGDSLRNSFIAEYIFSKNCLSSRYITFFLPNESKTWSLLHKLTFQKNRTQNYKFDFFSQFTAKVVHPPYQEGQPTAPEDEASGWFWWLNNAYGKRVVDASRPSTIMVYIVYYETLARFELLQLAAEAHTRFTPETPASEIEAFLAQSGKIDPFSGRPYRWDPAKQTLYSIGRQDLLTAEELKSYGGTSRIAVPCILFLRPPA